MNAIVIVFIPKRDGRPLTEAVTMPIGEALQRCVDSYDSEANILKSSKSNQSTPPFWTWFIENPRHCAA